jgi:hypothetical protein
MSSIPSPLLFLLDEDQHELHRSLVLAQISSALVCVAAFHSLNSQEEHLDGGIGKKAPRRFIALGGI